MEFHIVYGYEVKEGEVVKWTLPRESVLENLTYREFEGCREYYGILQRKDFDDFMSDVNLKFRASKYACIVGTVELGLIPAIAFEVGDESPLVRCYVTPHVEGLADTEAQWNRLEAAIISKYGSGD